MPEVRDDLAARLDALGSAAASRPPALPAGLADAVRARGRAEAQAVTGGGVPRSALMAAAVVIVFGVAVVMFGLPARGPGPAAEGAEPLPGSLLSMVRRFNGGASIDAAVNGLVSGAGGGRIEAAESGPVFRAIDARAGLVPN